MKIIPLITVFTLIACQDKGPCPNRTITLFNSCSEVGGEQRCNVTLDNGAKIDVMNPKLGQVVQSCAKPGGNFSMSTPTPQGAK